MLELSISEQQLVEFAREAFGEFITRFLLAGLAEEDVGRRWLFTIAFDNDVRADLNRRVQVITHEPSDGSSWLPRGRDPLVLLALLQLLTRVGESSNQGLLYDQEDILKILGWADTPETRHEIDQAVKRYFLITFKWEMSSTELVCASLTHYTAMENIFSESETINLELEDGRTKGTMNRIVFNSHFIGHLKRRSLFDLDWSRVTSVSYVPTS